jgi:hypothetical protein
MRLIDADSIPNPHFTLASNRIRMLDAIDETPTIKTKQIKYYDEDEGVWTIGEVIVDE